MTDEIQFVVLARTFHFSQLYMMVHGMAQHNGQLQMTRMRGVNMTR